MDLTGIFNLLFDQEGRIKSLNVDLSLDLGETILEKQPKLVRLLKVNIFSFKISGII